MPQMPPFPWRVAPFAPWWMQHFIISYMVGTVFPGIDEDTVAIVVSIEEVFSINFTPEDALPDTVGKLCELVKARLQGTRTSKCMSSVAFYALRRAMVRVLGCPRQSITPSTRLDSILSSGAARRREWKKIEKSLGVKMPLLAFSESIETFLSLTFFGIGVILVLFVLPKLIPAIRIGDRITAFCAACFGTFIFWAITRKKLQPLATQLPDGCSVGDLTKAIVARNFANVAALAGGWNEKEFWETLRDVIADNTAVERERITPETPFPAGLGIF